MDSQSQLTHAPGHHYEQDPLNPPVEGQEEHQGKTSIFKKVKAKAKKVKHSITHKSRKDHDNGDQEENEDDEDNDDDEEETVQDPEIHGAPVYDSAPAKDFATGPDVNIARPHADPVPSAEDIVCPGTFQTKVTDSAPKHDSAAPGNFAAAPKLGALKGTMGEKLREDTTEPKPRYDDDLPGPGYVSAAIKNFDTPHDVNTRQTKDTFGESISEEPKSPKRREDDFSEPPNYQPNAGVGREEGGVSPTLQSFDKMGISDEPQHEKGSGHPAAAAGAGAGAVGATSILHSFDKMGIHDEPQHKKESDTTGSHDQFPPSPSPSPSDTPIPEFSSHKTDPLSEDTPAVPESFNATRTTSDEHGPQDMNVDEPTTQQSGYIGKIPAVGSTIADKAITSKNVLASKVGYGGNNEDAPSTGFPRPAENEQSTTGKPQKGYLSSITGTALSAKDAVASKLGYGGSQTANPTTATEGTGTAQSPREAGIDQSTTGEPPKGYLSSITGTALSAKDAVASKLGYGGSQTANPTTATEGTGTAQSPQDMNVDQPTTQQSGYIGKIPAVGSTIADKALASKNVLASKVGYGGNNENAPSTGFPREAGIDQSTTGEPPKGYLSSITGTAASAKNVVASKLGYGGSETAVTEGTGTGHPTPATEGSETARSGGGVTGYVTEKLAPVYGTVAGAGTAVLSKLPGTGMGGQKNTTDRGVAGESDKGVAGMKGYISEKLKPGEEDKALSEVISDALHKKTAVKGVDEKDKSNIEAAVKDAFHKNDVEDMDTEDTPPKPMGKVTESDEVAARLGSSESEKAGHVTGTGNESPSSAGVVDKFKGAFTNWFGKGGETNPSQAFNDQTASHGTTGDAQKEGENVSYEGERKLQESTN